MGEMTVIQPSRERVKINAVDNHGCVHDALECTDGLYSMIGTLRAIKITPFSIRFCSSRGPPNPGRLPLLQRLLNHRFPVTVTAAVLSFFLGAWHLDVVSISAYTMDTVDGIHYSYEEPCYTDEWAVLE